MNMKKSIAGVMAGAMAVSAMATVVSADQDSIHLTYDLKTYVLNNNKDAAKVTVVANYEGSTVSADSVAKGYITFGADNGYVKPSKIYNKNGVEIGSTSPKGEWDWVDDATVNTAKDSEMVEFEFTARPYKDLVTGVEEKYQSFKATSEAGNTEGAYYDKNMGASIYSMKINTTGTDTYGKFDLRKYDLFNLGYSDGNPDAVAAAEAAGLTPVATNTYAVRDAVAKLTYKVPNIVTLNKANGWNWDMDIDAAKAESLANNYYLYTLKGDVTMSAEVFAGGFFNEKGYKKGMLDADSDISKWNPSTSKIETTKITNYEWKEKDAKGNENTYQVGNTFLVSKPTTVAVGSFTQGLAAETVWPFKTTLKPSLTTDTYQSGYVKNAKINENDVIAALKSRKAGGNYYTRPVAVINDAIANHDNVVFKFISYNNYVGTEKAHILNQWVNVDQGYDYPIDETWHNPSFGQHLYTNVADGYGLFDTSDYDQYGSHSSAWGINLFTGAVVVNSGLTMQLSDTDTFEWGTNSLSFDWFDITDEGKITDAKTFLTSMLLYTPVDWYWDSLEIVVSDEEDESVDASTSLDGDGDVIEDEEPEEIVEETEPEIVEEPEVVETEAAPVETAPSPATGNAPVALAVIPVALAAAAVVAKKRG